MKKKTENVTWIKMLYRRENRRWLQNELHWRKAFCLLRPWRAEENKIMWAYFRGRLGFAEKGIKEEGDKIPLRRKGIKSIYSRFVGVSRNVKLTWHKLFSPLLTRKWSLWTATRNKFIKNTGDSLPGWKWSRRIPAIDFSVWVAQDSWNLQQ